MKKKIIDFCDRSTDLAKKGCTTVATCIKTGSVAVGALAKKRGLQALALVQKGGVLMKAGGQRTYEVLKGGGKKTVEAIKRGSSASFDGLKYGGKKTAVACAKSSGFIVLHVKSGISKFTGWIRGLGFKVAALFRSPYGMPTLIFLALLIVAPLLYVVRPTGWVGMARNKANVSLMQSQGQSIEQERTNFVNLEQKITSTLARLEAKITVTEERIRQHVDKQVTRIEQQLQRQESTLALQQKTIRSAQQRSRERIGQQVQQITQQQNASVDQIKNTDKLVASVDDKLSTVATKLTALDAKVAATEKNIKQQVDEKLSSLEKSQRDHAVALENMHKEARLQTAIVQKNTGTVTQLAKTIKDTKFATPTKATVNERIRNEVNAQLKTIRQQKEAAEEKEDLTHKKKQLKKLLKEVLD